MTSSKHVFGSYGIMALLFFSAALVSAELSADFYDETCPDALDIIEDAVRAAVSKESRMGASLLRLHFHDCFVNGCDGSVLLDGATGEKNAVPNKNSLRGFELVDDIKAQLEKACAKVVSCADILAVAARDSVVALGGPTWTVLLGRRDSTTASKTNAENDLPPPTFDLQNLTTLFGNKQLSMTDMVALSGAHTIGQSQCRFFRDRIYNETNIDTAFATSLRANCPRSGGDNSLAPLDTATPNAFDNAYYTNLMTQKGLLHSDQVLFNGGGADNTVRSFASSAATFNSAFTTAMINMGNIAPKTGTQGQIRLVCSKVNS